MNENCQYSYLIQVGLNMLGMSTTAVQVNIIIRITICTNCWKFYLTNYFIFQTVINLDRPDVAIRSAVFFGANQFHLFLLSLPGQILLDHCADFANAMYVFNIINYNNRYLEFNIWLILKQIWYHVVWNIIGNSKNALYDANKK